MTSDSASPAAIRAPGFGEFVALIASLMALTALSIDIMLPALTLIRDDYGLADPNRQQLVVTVYLLGFGAGQLFYGPLSDRFGRKPTLAAGLALYVAASVACAWAGSFDALIAARFVQGVGNAAPRVIAVAVVRDLYGGRRMAEVMSFVMMVFIIVPAIAPAMGGGVLLAAPWPAIFWLLGAIAVAILLWTMIRLPESRPRELREPLSVRWLVSAFVETLSTRQTVGYTLAIAAAFGGMMGYITSAEQVFVHAYDAGAMFPIYFGMVAAALAAAAMVNSRLVSRLGMRVIGHAAICGYVVVAALHVALELALGILPLPAFLILMMMQHFCFGCVMPNYNSLAMEPMGRIAGTASSFVGAVTTAVAAFLGWVVGQSFDGTPLPLAVGFAAFGAASLALTLATERGRLFRPSR